MCEDMFEVCLQIGRFGQKVEQLLATMVDLETAMMLAKAWFEKNFMNESASVVIKRMPIEKYELIKNWKEKDDE